MVSKEDVLLAVPIIVLVLIGILGSAGVFSAPLPGAGQYECNLGFFCNVGVALGFPKEWLNTQTFLWYSLIPLLGIWLIIYGFLDRIHIFGKNALNGLLSFLIAFSMVPLQVFVIIVSILFSIMGIYSVVLFVILFFMGTGFLAHGLYRGWRYYGLIEKELDIYDEEYRRLKKQEKAYEDSMKKIKRQIDNRRFYCCLTAKSGNSHLEKNRFLTNARPRRRR